MRRLADINHHLVFHYSAIINALAFPLAYVGEVLFTKCWRCCCKGGAKTQHDLNELYRPPKFALAERTGQFLSVVFYTLMLSSGAPLLWPVVCMYCILQYLVDKRLLLRSTQQPPRYSGKLASMMRLVLPWAGVLHLSVSVWMYGHAALPSYDVGGEMCEAVRENRIDRETSAEQDLMMDTFGLQGDDLVGELRDAQPQGLSRARFKEGEGDGRRARARVRMGAPPARRAPSCAARRRPRGAPPP